MRRWLVEAAAGICSEEEVTQAAPTDLETEDATQVVVKESSTVAALPDIFLRADVTHVAERLISLLESGYKLDHELVQVLVEVMDSEHSRRREIILLRSNLLHKKRESRAHVAITLIHKLAAHAHVEPHISLRTRQKLGRLLTDYTLAEISADRRVKGSQAAASTLTQHTNHRKWLRELAIWFFRGAAASVVSQFVLSLFTGSRTILDILFSSNWGFGFAHLLLIISGALLVLAIKHKRRFDYNSSEQTDFVWKISGSVFGVLLALILFNDILWACGLK
jgi:hypothetical protein